jgi:hypothetical protein
MPNLPSFSILDNRVKKYKKDYLIEKMGAAFEWVVLETLIGLNSAEIDETIVDEGNDGGIDAIYISGTDVYIFTCTYAETFENAARNFPQNKLDNLVVTIQKILTKDIKQKDVNDVLWEKINDIWNLLVNGAPNFYFYICSNKEKPTELAIRRFEDSLRQFHFVQFRYYDLESIVKIILREQFKIVNGRVTFIARNHFQKSDGPLKAVVATINAKDIIDLISDENDPSQINENVFNDNVRIDLGLKNPINKGIKESALSDKNYEFWYLNNGIMLVCDECRYLPNSISPVAELDNFQIVNGGQTSRTLFHAYREDPEKVKNVDILVRIVETKDRSISERISETANKQTPVRTRDLHSNDLIQRKLEKDFELLGYFYERKKNQYADKPTASRLDAELLGQLFLSYNFDIPSEARNAKSIVFGEEYRNIFNEEETTASKLLFPYLLYKPLELIKREVQRKKRLKQPLGDNESFIPFATFHIIYAMKIIAQIEGVDLSTVAEQENVRNKAIKYISDIINKEMMNRGELYTHDRFFKEAGTNKLINDYIKNCYGIKV